MTKPSRLNRDGFVLITDVKFLLFNFETWKL